MYNPKICNKYFPKCFFFIFPTPIPAPPLPFPAVLPQASFTPLSPIPPLPNPHLPSPSTPKNNKNTPFPKNKCQIIYVICQIFLTFAPAFEAAVRKQLSGKLRFNLHKQFKNIYGKY